MNKEEILMEYLDNHHGYITASELLNINISKPDIRKFVATGIIKRVGHGIYINPKLAPDEYYILQIRFPYAIYSDDTAFYILSFINQKPDKIDITVPRDIKIRGEYNAHRVSNHYYNIGIIEVMSPSGNPVKVYNIERCICDMLRKGYVDLEFQNHILNSYFNSKEKDIDKLLKYAKIFNIYEQVNIIAGVMEKNK